MRPSAVWATVTRRDKRQDLSIPTAAPLKLRPSRGRGSGAMTAPTKRLRDYDSFCLSSAVLYFIWTPLISVCAIVLQPRIYLPCELTPLPGSGSSS